MSPIKPASQTLFLIVMKNQTVTREKCEKQKQEKLREEEVIPAVAFGRGKSVKRWEGDSTELGGLHEGRWINITDQQIELTANKQQSL